MFRVQTVQFCTIFRQISPSLVKAKHYPACISLALRHGILFIIYTSKICKICFTQPFLSIFNVKCGNILKNYTKYQKFTQALLAHLRIIPCLSRVNFYFDKQSSVPSSFSSSSMFSHTTNSSNPSSCSSLLHSVKLPIYYSPQ